MTDTTLRDYFSLPLADAKKLWQKVIIDPRPDPDFYKERFICLGCKGTGECPECFGRGWVAHECDCDFCDHSSEDCPDCDASGKCSECMGRGFNEYDKRPTVANSIILDIRPK